MGRVGTLLAWCGFGILGLLIDSDHVLCAYRKGISLAPLSNLSGCKVWHSDLLPVSGIVLCLSFALLIGFLSIHVWQIGNRNAR